MPLLKIVKTQPEMKHDMEFCAECGSRLQPKKISSGNQVLIMMVCTKCDKKQQSNEDYMLKPKVIEHNPKQLVAVIGKEEQELTTMPTINMECPRCNNNTANVWLVQTRGSDESSTQFLRCTNCGYTLRECT
jgi:DNA-directed RNA polymerase subunit M